MDTIQIDPSKILIVENKIPKIDLYDKGVWRKLRTIDPALYYEAVINDHKRIIAAYEQFPNSVHLSNTNYVKDNLIYYDRDGNPIDMNRAIEVLLRTNFRPVGGRSSDAIDGPEDACYFSETEKALLPILDTSN